MGCAGLAAADASAAAARPTPESCAASLTCTVTDIDSLSMTERLTFVRALESGPASQLGASDRWHNIEGIIEFFRDQQLGAPGSWISYVDAGILEGIERGTAIALGQSADDFGNPGSALWASYLTRLSRGELNVRGDHDLAWSQAEQASTEHGVAVAASHGLHATDVEQRFYDFSDVYRWALRNRPAVLDLLAIYGPWIDPDLARLRVPFYDWFTDVRNSTPAYKGAVMSYDVAELHPIAGVIGAAGLLLAYVPEMFKEFRAEVPQAH